MNNLRLARLVGLTFTIVSVAGLPFPLGAQNLPMPVRLVYDDGTSQEFLDVSRLNRDMVLPVADRERLGRLPLTRVYSIEVGEYMISDQVRNREPPCLTQTVLTAVTVNGDTVKTPSLAWCEIRIQFLNDSTGQTQRRDERFTSFTPDSTSSFLSIRRIEFLTPAARCADLIRGVRGLEERSEIEEEQTTSLTANLQWCLPREGEEEEPLPSDQALLLDHFIWQVRELISEGLLRAELGQPLLDDAQGIVEVLRPGIGDPPGA